ncbi:mucin-5AC-like isoform X2 [Daphnia pulex]|uniref:mucin-5AC-like isoform X2 n=1 Tax=Daphnia pulex TaxID=6669 RepID=UPI001EDDD9AD|nr:mucin-5AC-like isoform X2 [Daphnia pulex]
MAGAIEIFLPFTLMCTAIWACEDGQVDHLTARQSLDEQLQANSYPANPWVFPYYYNIQPRLPFAGYADAARIPFYRKSPGYFAKNVNDGYRQEDRLGFGNLGANLFSSLFTLPTRPFRPFANLVGRMDACTCTSSSGDAGICTSALACSLLSRKPSGSCNLGRVCCVDVLATCGGTVTLNNTYWQSPSTPVSAPSTCALTVRLDSTLAEQALPICQIRLDFVSFTTAQPTAGTCTDTFQVSGATTVAPTICGNNDGQHMYLDVPSSASTPTDVRLTFNFAAGMTTRSWKIKIALLPCGTTYLAPTDCLQYFSAASGRVKSFNWQDVAGTATRQLNNQDYNICFRTELVSSQRATQMCLSICAVSNGGDAFSITTPTSTDAAAATAAVVTATTNLAKAQTTLTNAQATLATAQTTLADAQTALTNAQNNIAPTQAALTAAQDALATAQDAVPVAETALTDAQGALTTAETDLATAQGTLTDARTALNKAYIDLAAAMAAIPPDYAAIDVARAALTTAQTAIIDALAVVDGAQTVANTAQTNVNNAQTTLTNKQTAVTDAQTAVDTAQLAAVNAQTAVTDAQTAVDTAQTNVNNAPAAVTDAQTAVTTAQAALTAAQTAAANAVASAAALSGVGTSAIVNGVNTATCLYDFLLISSAQDSTNVEADRYCGNALNPATTPIATSVPVCTPIKPFRMTFQTDNTEEAVAAGANILPAPADTANTGFCLDYQEK